MNSTAMRILYVGPVLPGSTTLQRMLALRRLGHSVTEVQTTGLVENRSVAERFSLHLGFPVDRVRANERLQALSPRAAFDVVWCDKAITLSTRALLSLRKRFPRAIFVSYSPDDMLVRLNAGRRFRAALPLFDLHFTTKRHNLEALRGWGARRVELVRNGYAPETHRPMPVRPGDRLTLGGAIGFVGDYEAKRAQSLLYLARQGLPVRIWGTNWGRHMAQVPPSLQVETHGVYGADYARAICNFEINLGFLRKTARDQSTTRSIEIPACGGFLLAERTEEHQQLFVEGVEAEFFATDEEMLQKCRYYLQHPGQRNEIAAAGQRRCHTSGYSNDELLDGMLGIAGALAERRTASTPAGRATRTPPPAPLPPQSLPLGAVDTPVTKHYSLLFLGNDWWGSDARAAGAALRRAGHYLVEVQDVDFIPQHWTSLTLKLVRRVLARCMQANFNENISRQAAASALDFVLVFKGRYLLPDTMRGLKALGLPLYCVYPDVSFLDHGEAIVTDLPLYDCVFTTKAFHVHDSSVIRRTRDLRLVSHGYDPEVHRPVSLPTARQAAYACDVSFVGCWSVKKENLLRQLVGQGGVARLRIWGPGWDKADAAVQECWERRGAYGDELAIIYGASRINLGLLSEAGTGTTEGDRTTARSWQIPACGGFMLHEHTDEIARAFDVENEIATFHTPGELAQQVARFLADDPERDRRRLAALRRSRQGVYTYDAMVREILRYHESRATPSGRSELR